MQIVLSLGELDAKCRSVAFSLIDKDGGYLAQSIVDAVNVCQVTGQARVLISYDHPGDLPKHAARAHAEIKGMMPKEVKHSITETRIGEFAIRLDILITARKDDDRGEAARALHQQMEALNQNVFVAISEYEFDISTRLMNFFLNLEVQYFGELAQKRENELRGMKGYGRKTILEAKGLLHRMNLSLGMTIPNWSALLAAHQAKKSGS